MSEQLDQGPSREVGNGDFEAAETLYLQSREAMVEEIKKLCLADLVRLLRRDDPVAQLAGSSGVYSEISRVHFPGEKPGDAFNFLLTMALRHVKDDELDSEAPLAQAWVLRDWDYVFGLETPVSE